MDHNSSILLHHAIERVLTASKRQKTSISVHQMAFLKLVLTCTVVANISLSYARDVKGYQPTLARRVVSTVTPTFVATTPSGSQAAQFESTRLSPVPEPTPPAPVPGPPSSEVNCTDLFTGQSSKCFAELNLTQYITN